MYLSLRGRRRAVEIVFCGIVAISAAAVVSDVLELRLLDRLIAGDPVTDAEIDNNDDRQAIIGSLQLLAFIVGAAVFIAWLYRAYGNLGTFARSERRYGTGWAIGGWFVPVMNLWRPKQVINDVWRAGEPGSRPGALLRTWWLLFLATSALGWVAGAAYGSEDAEEIRSGTITYIVSDSLDIVAAALAVWIVRIATRRLDERSAARTSPGPEAWDLPIGTGV